MSGRSPIESLQRLAPVTDGDAARVFGDTAREELLAAVTDLPFGRGARSRRARSRRPLVLVLAAAVVIGTTAAVWVVRHAPARETTSVQCLIDGNDAVIPSVSGDPVHDCALGWKRDHGTDPPPLVAYDNTLGGVTVLPRSQKPPAGWTPIRSQDVALIELQDSLDDYINGLTSRCLDGKAATALAKQRLAQLGFAGWSVGVRDPGSASSPGTCLVTDVVDPGTQTVTLIPTQGPIAPATAHALADKLRPLTQGCESLPAAVAKVRADAAELGLSESARTYELNAVTDNSLRCASISETVGGTIFLTVRGPAG